MDGCTESWKRQEGLVQLLTQKLPFVPGCCLWGGELLCAALEGVWQVPNPPERVQAALGDGAQRAASGFQVM